MPCLFTDHYYQLRQEDAAEFLQMHLLREEASPTLSNLTKSFGKSVLICAHCSRPREATAEEFQTFEVPIELSGPDIEEPIRFTDVQSAFNAFLKDDYNDFQFVCRRCQHNQWTKALHMVTFPELLVLTLKRYRTVQVESGELEQRCVTHTVATTDVLDFQGQLYDLRSVIVHFSDTMNGGHYIALAKHETDTGSWWLYNDAERREASPEQVATTEGFRDYGPMKSYVLFYEKRRMEQ